MPRPLSTFVGREQELADLRQRFSTARLITLTGPPGTGKTRLALAFAATAGDAFPEGVFFVPLAPIQRQDEVLATVAHHLRVRKTGRQPPAAALARALEGQRVLLVLDNFEHLLTAAPAVHELLTVCPELTVLVTSRAPLGVSGEQRVPVGPLPLPPVAPIQNPLDLGRVPSVRLFVERAAAVAPSFELSPANALAVAELCVRLDGLPLAIELAAARCRVLEPPELLRRLQQRLWLSDEGPRDAPPRQRALRAAISWSYELLTASEQRLFRRLGAFTGGCTLEAAEAVACAANERPQDIIDAITLLVDHSLLRSEPDCVGCPRITMLETIREFALEELAHHGELELTQRRHATVFVGLAEQAASPRLDGPDGPSLLTRLELDHDNLRQALSWLLDHGEAESAVQLAGALWSFWEVHGHLGEGLTWLDAALAVDGPVSPTLRARALMGLAAMHRARGDYAAAITPARASATILRALDDRDGLAESLVILSDIIALSGDAAEATELAAESLAIRRSRGDTVGSAWAMFVLGNALAFQTDFAAAGAQYEQALTLRGDQRDNIVDAWLLRSLGAMLGGGGGDAQVARSLLEQALELFRARGDRLGMGAALLALGDLGLRRNERTAGRARLEEAEAQLLRADQPALAAVASLRLGRPMPAQTPDSVGALVIEAGWRWALGRDIPRSVAVTATFAPRGAAPLSGKCVAPAPDGLTSREREVLSLVARHYSNREIAEELVLSIRTVERHVANIYAKIGVSSRRQATAYARERGVLGAE